MIDEVEGTMAICHRDTSHVPKDEHIPPLLMGHIKGCNNELFALSASIGVQPMSQNKEGNLGRNIAICIVLLDCGSGRQEKEDKPRQADLKEHLKIHYAENTGVQLSSHKEVVDRATSHLMLGSPHQATEVSNEADTNSGEDRNTQ